MLFVDNLRDKEGQKDERTNNGYGHPKRYCFKNVK